MAYVEDSGIISGLPGFKDLLLATDIGDDQGNRCKMARAERHADYPP